MDAKTLVVGQDVYMLKPPYPFWFCIDEGKVVKVTPDGVDVQVVDRQTADAAYAKRKDKGQGDQDYALTWRSEWALC